MTCSELETALKGVCEATYNASAPAGLNRSIVWTRYGRHGIYGDDRAQINVELVQLDLWCQDAGADTFLVSVSDTLDALDVAYRVEDVSWDWDAACWRCILQCEI